MVARRDPAMMELGWVEVSDMRRRSMVDRKLQHLVEIAVVQPAIPPNRQGIPTHDAGGGGGIERVGQARHVLVIVTAFNKELQEPADRHVGNRVEPVEFDSVPGPQFFLELRFDGLLLWRQERADGIIDQVQCEPAIQSAIAESVQETERFHRFLKNSIASLRIGLAGTVRRKRGDDLDLVVSQKFHEIRLGREQQYGQITAIHHMSAKPAGLFDKPAEVGVQLRCAACDIDCGNVRLGQSLHTVLRRFQGHGLGTIRAGIHMAVATGLIAQFADVDLKDGDAGRLERKQIGLSEAKVKRWGNSRLIEEAKLFSR